MWMIKAKYLEMSGGTGMSSSVAEIGQGGG